MIKVGLILYSVRDEMAKDPIATVKKVAELGYKNIEVCNHNAIHDAGCGFGVAAEDLKAEFDKFGSQVVSAHIFPIEMADMQKVVEYEQVLGNKNIVNPMGRFTTYDDLMRQIEVFNQTGKMLHEMGMSYLYHNHHQEYRTFKGKTIMDYMIENTDPDYFSLELDTFWTMRAGFCPIEMLKHFGKRVKLVHQKDFAWDATVPINLIGLTAEEREMKEDEVTGIDGKSDYAKKGNHTTKERDSESSQFSGNSAFTEIGQGIMNIQGIIDAANEYTNAEYIILEQDYTRMATQFDSIEKSMESFKKFNNISWEA